jgi:hypothetical protein
MEHAFSQIDEIVAGGSENLAEGNIGAGLELDVVGKEFHAGPDFFSWCAKDREDLVELVEVGVARKERYAQQQLRKDATDSPDVNALEEKENRGMLLCIVK